MHTLRRLTRQHALASVWTLVLALLLSAGWGQVHRVLHGGAWLQATAEAPAARQLAKAAEPASAAQATPGATSGLADEDGSSLCKLLDQLTHGAGAVQAPAFTWAQALPPTWPIAPERGRLPCTLAAFDARGPPRLS